MATHHYRNAFLSVAGVDLSDHVRSLTLNYEAEPLDKTMMGDTTRVHLAGLLGWTVDVEWGQDYAAAEVDATLFALVGAAAFALIIRPDAGAKSATNPEYTGNALLANYQPLGGTVGDFHLSPSNFVAASALARDAS